MICASDTTGGGNLVILNSTSQETESETDHVLVYYYAKDGESHKHHVAAVDEQHKGPTPRRNALITPGNHR